MKKKRERFVNHVYGLIAGTIIAGVVAPIVSMSLGVIVPDIRFVTLAFAGVWLTIVSGYTLINFLEARWGENDE